STLISARDRCAIGSGVENQTTVYRVVLQPFSATAALERGSVSTWAWARPAAAARIAAVAAGRARALWHGRKGPREKTRTARVPRPDRVAVDLVIPVSAGVTDQEQASRRREQINAGGPDGTADRVDDDLEALARQAGKKLSGIDDLVVGEPCLLGGVQVAG